MKTSVKAFVYAVAAGAMASIAGQYWLSPKVDLSLLDGAAWLALVAFIGNILSYRIQGSTFGAVSFIPFLTAIVLYPAWPTLALVCLVAAVAEFARPKEWIKRSFNVGQILLSSSVAAAVYSNLGGKSLQISPEFQFVPHVAAVVSFLLINTLAVAIAVGLAEGKSILRLWYEGNVAGIAYDIVAVPIVYGFARAYVDWGFWGIAVLCALILGMRLTYRSKHQLETTNKELLELFVQTVEYRDPYTSGHSQRVSRFSRIIAQVIGLSPKQIDSVSKAALLHDVGKIHEVFASILMKPGKLTAEERAVMELHPIKSAELVARITELQSIVPAVRAHHENWDGTGYPDRLQGEKIPIEARIIRIADTVDAMLTDRPYRKAMTDLEVRAELSRFSGSQFDPEICRSLTQSPEFTRLFDKDDDGQIRSLSQILAVMKRRNRPPVALAS